MTNVQEDLARRINGLSQRISKSILLTLAGMESWEWGKRERTLTLSSGRRYIDIMRNLGLVEPDPSEGYSGYVRLTKEGMDIRQQADQMYSNSSELKVFKSFGVVR